MRENNSVPELREKIKSFLASQGMIKGHSGSGSRNVDSNQPGPVLMLSDPLGGKMPGSSSNGAVDATSGPRSAGSSAGSSPQSPRSPPVPPSTLYHHPPPPHYSPPHAHSAHHDGPRYPSINTSYTRDHSRSGGNMVPYSPLSPETATPATATSTHGHGHGHGDPYSAISAHRPSLSFQASHPFRPDDRPGGATSTRIHPGYTDARYGSDPSLDSAGRRSPESGRYSYYGNGNGYSPVAHSPTLPPHSATQTSPSYSPSQSQYPGSSLHTTTSSC